MTVDLDSLRAVFDLHNTAGMDFPDALREHLRPDAEWVESPLLPGATTHRGREAVHERRRRDTQHPDVRGECNHRSEGHQIRPGEPRIERHRRPAGGQLS